MSSEDGAKRRDGGQSGEIGARIRAVREEAGLSPQALAERLQVRPSALIAVESGVRVVSLELVRDAARALNVPLRVLVDPVPAGAGLALSPEERALVEAFRAASAERQRALTALVRAAAGLGGDGG
jgi:transcriptional regulator with XRE-family HTH domain